MKNHIKLYEEYSNESQFFKTKEEVKSWLKKVAKLKPFNKKTGEGGYVINDDLTVDVYNCDVDLNDEDIEYLPVRFGEVVSYDYGDDEENNFKSSDECNFYIRNCGLKSLVGSPRTVNDYFDCSDNMLENLQGCPEYAHIFDCSKNWLTSLEGSSDLTTTSFYCNENENLRSLKGGPSTLEGDPGYNCDNCDIRSLEGMPSNSLRYFSCVGNKWLTTLKYMPDVEEECHVSECGLVTLYHAIDKTRDLKYYRNPCTKGYDDNGGFDESDKSLEVHAKAITIGYDNYIDDWHFTTYDRDKSEFLEDLFEEEPDTFWKFVEINPDILVSFKSFVEPMKRHLAEIHRKDPKKFYSMYERYPQILTIYKPENDETFDTYKMSKETEGDFY